MESTRGEFCSAKCASRDRPTGHAVQAFLASIYQPYRVWLAGLCDRLAESTAAIRLELETEEAHHLAHPNSCPQKILPEEREAVPYP